MGERRREAWTKWKALVAEQASSGLSVAAFCRGKGIHPPQVFAWKKRLNSAPAEGFVELRLAPEPHRGGPAIEVRLGTGYSVIVEPGFDVAHLRAVVAALEGRP